MTFLNAAILFGLGLTAIPVILHLLLRNRPKKLPFPALQLLLLTKTSNTRRLRLKHFWLLLLRILLIALIVLALARPTLPAADYSLTWGDLLRLGLILVVALVVDRLMTLVRNRKAVPAAVMRSRKTSFRSLLAGLAFVLFLLLFLWPYGARITAQWNDPQTPMQENFPVSAVLLFDVSPSMEYRQENLTRLDSAQQLAEQLLSRLPNGSQLSVSHNASTDPPVFLSDSTAAHDRIDRLQITELTESLDRRIQAAMKLQVRDRERTLEEMGSASDAEAADRFIREIYLFTDLSAHAWRLAASATVERLMEESPWLAVYLVDVSSNSQRNTTLGWPKLSAEAVPHGSTLVVRSELQATGKNSGAQTVELLIRNVSGEMTKQGQRDVMLSDEEGAKVEFPLSAQVPGFLEGEIHLVSSDPMAFDNRRYFTVEVIAPPKVLVLSEDRSRRELWSTLLEKLRYVTTEQPPGALQQLDLSKFDLVCLLSVESLSKSSWSRLEEFVTQGGGLFVSLGKKSIDPLSYTQSISAKTILPGLPAAYLKFTPPEFLDFGIAEHPLLDRIDEYGGPGGLLDTEVRHRWKVDVADDSRLILGYTDRNQSPALLERSTGRGRVFLLTTSILPGDWNDLFLSRLNFFILSDLMMQSLQSQQFRKKNYQVGETCVVNLPRERSFHEYLFRSGLEQTAGQLEPGTEQLQLGQLKRSGHYDVRSRPPEFRTSFSANISQAESDLTVLSVSQLDDLFGEGRYGVARSLEELEPVIRSRRLGQEMVPLLLFLLVLVFACEQFVANHFYEDTQSGHSSPESTLKQVA